MFTYLWSLPKEADIRYLLDCQMRWVKGHTILDKDVHFACCGTGGAVVGSLNHIEAVFDVLVVHKGGLQHDCLPQQTCATEPTEAQQISGIHASGQDLRPFTVRLILGDSQHEIFCMGKA